MSRQNIDQTSRNLTQRLQTSIIMTPQTGLAKQKIPSLFSKGEKCEQEINMLNSIKNNKKRKKVPLTNPNRAFVQDYVSSSTSRFPNDEVSISYSNSPDLPIIIRNTYKDHANFCANGNVAYADIKKRGGIKILFPEKLHNFLCTS